MANAKIARGCLITNCTRKHKARGLCGTHYFRWRVNGDPLAISRRENVILSKVNDELFPTKFWALVAITADITRCWLWQHTTTTAGYGQVNVDGERVYAHRLAWQLANGRPPHADLEVLHSCDNPPCVNPNHLREGTHKDNIQDAMIRNRMQVGALRYNTKLNDELVKQIRQELASGRSGQWVSTTYGLAPMTVSKIKHRQTWKHVV